KEQTQEQLEGGRFARSVGAEEAEYLALDHFHAQRIERPHLFSTPEVAVNLRQVAGLNDDFVGHGPVPKVAVKMPENEDVNAFFPNTTTQDRPFLLAESAWQVGIPFG